MKPFICWKCLPDSNLNLVCRHIVQPTSPVLKKSLYVRDQRGIIALKWTSFSAGQSNYCNCSSRHFFWVRGAQRPGAAVTESLQPRYQMVNRMTLARHASWEWQILWRILICLRWFLQSSGFFFFPPYEEKHYQNWLFQMHCFSNDWN